MTCLLTSLFSVSFFFNSIDNRTNTVVAIKIIDLEEAEDEIEDIQQEITVLSQCDSAFVTKYHGSYLKVFAVQHTPTTEGILAKTPHLSGISIFVKENTPPPPPLQNFQKFLSYPPVPLEKAI